MSIRIPFTAANGRWRIGTPPEPEVYQLDDNAHKLSVVGDLPEGYAWTMYVSVYGKYKNSILLTKDTEGASVTLTADQLAYGDTKYFMQLVGVNGSITRKTNEISVYIPKSLIDGDTDWPETPDVFEQAQEVVLGAVTEMKETGDAIVRNAAAGSSTVYNIADALTLQGYISYNLGTAVGDNENYVRSPFLFLPKGTRLHLSGFKNADSVATIAVYDAEKTYAQSSSIRGTGISDSSSFQFLIFTMPEDGYVRFSARRVNLADILIRNVPAEKELNILVLGNSFSQDAYAYLPPVLNELLPDYAITYGVAYGDSFDPADHLEAYNNDLKYDRWNLWRSGADHWSHYTGTSATKTLAEILPLYDWNVVYLQCAGVISEAGMETSMTEDNIEPGRELLRILQAGIGHPFTFLTGQWLSTVGETEADTLASYFRMRKAIKYVADRLGVDGVIPVGAGIAFARTDDDLDALGDMLYTDGQHQQAGLPALISAYVIAQYILEMLGREDTAVYGSTFVPDATGVSAINSSAMTHGSPVGVTAENILKAQEIAVAAAAHPDSVYGETDPSEEGGGGGAVTSVNGKTGAVTLSASDVGAYTKPASGIPASDLAPAVQTSLGKADTALQPSELSYVTPQQFGAKGDGTTDDTEAIQAAIDYAQSNSIRGVFLPVGTYKITAPLVLTTGVIADSAGSRYWDGNGTVLTGENVGTTRIIKSGTATYQSASTYSDAKKQTFAQTSYDAVIVGDGQATGHVIRNLTLVNESSATDTYTIVSWVSRMTIENVNSITTSHGINLYSYFNRIENVRFNGASDVLHIDDGTSTFVSRTFISGAANPYCIKSAYTVLNNMAADGCTGSIYQVGGAGVVMNGCGAESPNATYHIYCPVNDTELTVIGGMWYGQTAANAALVAMSKNRCKVTLIHPCISIHANADAARYLVHTTTAVSGIEFNCHDLSYQNASGYAFTEYAVSDHKPTSGSFSVNGRPIDYLGNPLDWKMGESGAEFWNGSEFVPAVYRQITPTNYNVTPTLGKRLTADGEADYASMWITDYIPCASGDVIYGKLYLNDRSAQALAMYDSSKNLLKYVAFNNLSNAAYGVTYNGGTTAASGANSLVIPIGEGSGWNASTAFIRLTGHNNLAPASCPFTVNETTDGITADFALRSELPSKVSDLTNDAGYQTAQDVQTAISGVMQLPSVSASDNGKFLRVVNGAWAAATVPSAESNSFGGGS